MEDDDPIFPRDLISVLELRALATKTQHALTKLQDRIEVELLS